MKAIKNLFLALSLVSVAAISMASNKGSEANTQNSNNKSEITKQANFEGSDKIFDETADMVILEAANNPTDRIPLDTRNAISEKLTYPEFAQDDMRKDVVAISFTYTEDGYMKILDLNSSDEKLNQYIISKLESIRLTNGSVTIGKEYFMRFEFKLL
jgi:hypothetical protein